MKSPEPLSPSARYLLELGSQVEPPSEEACDRMDRALSPLFRILPPIAPPGATRSFGSRSQSQMGSELASSPRRGGPLWRSIASSLGSATGKFVLAFGALAATTSAAFWMGRASARLAPPPMASTVPAALTPSPPSFHPLDDLVLEQPLVTGQPPPNPAPLTGPEGASARAPMQDTPPRAGSGQQKPRRASGLGMEIEQLARAEGALRAGNPGRALAQLGELRKPRLLEQAEALRAVAECEIEVSRSDSARAQSAGRLALERSSPARVPAHARAVIARWPASAFQARIRDACGL
jgi:hypothetical protein